MSRCAFCTTKGQSYFGVKQFKGSRNLRYVLECITTPPLSQSDASRLFKFKVTGPASCSSDSSTSARVHFTAAGDAATRTGGTAPRLSPVPVEEQFGFLRPPYILYKTFYSKQVPTHRRRALPRENCQDVFQDIRSTSELCSFFRSFYFFFKRH